ncbi:MAG TPA: biotin/lipoyl-binding protein [Anaerovoracaceae bacterium]|nr:biotin/lipoyl-binding protein [Anaerovoracaceae bacterium]
MAKLTSPMAGKVQEINVKVGDKVEEDDDLAVIE